MQDFHKVTETEKKRIADIVKIFIDAANKYPLVKIMCIGAVGTARELIQLDSNLSARIAKMLVPLLNDSEIKSLILKGNSLLSIEMDTSLIEKICLLFE